jgi:hypothetical protein
MKPPKAILPRRAGSPGQAGQDKSQLGIVVKRICIFLFSMSLVVFFYWVVGNFRRFLDSTQLFLLSTLRWLSLGQILASAFGLGALLVGSARAGRPRTPLSILGYALLLGLAALALVLADGLGFLAGGLA